MKIFTGNSNTKFAEGVAKYLDIPLGKVDLRKFSDGELYVAFDENIVAVKVAVNDAKLMDVCQAAA